MVIHMFCIEGVISLGIVRQYQHYYRTYNRNIRLYLWHFFTWQLGALIYNLFFPLYLLSANIDEQVMGSLFALNTLSMAVCAIPAGFLADRLGRRKSFILGSAPSLLVAALKLTTTNIAFLRLLYLVDGAFIMLFLASSSPFIVENTEPENRIHAFSLSAMMMLGAGIFGNFFGGYLPQVIRLVNASLGDITVYRIIFVCGTVLMFVAFTFLFKLIDVPTSVAPSANRKLVLPGKTDMKFLFKYMVAAGFIALGAAHFMPFATTFFRRTYGASPSQLGALFSVTQLTVFIATAIAPSLAERWAPIPAIIFTRIVSLPLLFGISTVHNFYFAGGLYMLRNAFMQMSSPLEANFFVSNISPEVRATANGINNMAMSSLRSLASYSAGIIITRSGRFGGYTAAIQVMLVCYIFSTVFLYVFFARGKKLLP
ncbi:MAG: MFS transporter [Bacillota bacterium]|nr:MAG: MFS transporter [Bacillota bacterium]